MKKYPYGNIVSDLSRLENCMMPEEQYREYVRREVSIRRMLHDSIHDIFRYHDYVVTGDRIVYQLDYDNSTIAKSGCGIICISHASRGKYTINDLVEKAWKKGYLHYERGTYHVLFDRLGAKRLKKARDIFKYLLQRKIVTVLIPGHYINLVGIKGENFLVEDSRFRERQEIPIMNILESMQIAWAWINIK